MFTKWQDDKSEVPILVQEPKGLSSARQLALENSSGEWVAITDIDVRPDKIG